MGIRSLGYLIWQTPQAESWRTFGTEVLGMMAVDGPDGAIRFRTDDRPFRFVAVPGDAPQVTLGFEVVDDLDLEDAVRALEDAGTKVEVATDDEARERLVTGLARFEDPAGVPVELFHGPVLDHHDPVQTPLVSRFVTGEQGMGHVVVGTEKVAATVELYRRVLGFRRRNTMRLAMPDPDGTPYSVLHFLGCNPRHHTLGVVAMPFPGNLVHFMIEAAELDDVGRAYDRVHDTGTPIAMTLGRHSNDRMVSFYCMAPDGAMVEFGWGGLVVDEPETTYEITRTSFWGHRPPKR